MTDMMEEIPDLEPLPYLTISGMAHWYFPGSALTGAA